MKRLVSIIATCTVSVMIFSCAKTQDTTPTGDPGPKYQAVKSVMTSSCALSGCHSSSSRAGGLNLESDAVIVDHAYDIKAYAVDMGTMPPSGSLSATAKTAISDWVAAGGKITN